MAVHKNGVKQGGAPKLDDCLTPDDNTDLDASTARHGLLLKLGGGTTNFLRADGSWAAPPGAAGGEANTASNQGSGTAVFIQKTGVDLEFNAIKSENNRLSVALDGVTHDVELTVNEANIDHDALTNFAADEHFTEASIDHTNITAGNGADHTYIDQDVTTSGTPSFSSVTATTVNATTLDTNVAAAGVTLAGTTLAADGTDTHIDITVTPKGNAGIVIASTSPPAVTTNKLYNNAGVLTFDGVSLESGGGDFTGPGSSTDNAIVRFDGTGGKTGQNSGITIDDSNNMTMAGELDMNSQDIDNAKTVTFIAEVDDGNSGAADTIDWTTGQKHKSTLTANCTYTFTAPQGPCNLLLKVVQDGTGSRTVTWPATVKWPTNGTAPTLSTGVNDVDIITFYYDGTNYYGVASLDFA